MGRGKKRAGQARLSSLAEGGTTALAPARERRARPSVENSVENSATDLQHDAIALSSTPLSTAPRTRMLPEHLKPRYAAAEPDADVLRYARTHAGNVARGEIKGAVLLLRDNMRYLRRGFPALDTLLEAVIKRAVVEADASAECESLRARAYELSRSHLVSVRDDPELTDAVRQALVTALRQEGDPFAAAQAVALAERRERLAAQAARSLLSNTRESLVANWLQPLYLDRFLWKAYGRDYDAMPWPFAEQLQPVIAQALAASDGPLLDQVLPQMITRFWPEVADLVQSELQERTFSAKWDLERLSQIVEGR